MLGNSELQRTARKYGVNVVSVCPIGESAPGSKPENENGEKSFFSENKPNLQSEKTANNTETPLEIGHIGHLDTNFPNIGKAENMDRAALRHGSDII